MKLQGVGREEWLRYGMETLSHRNLADLCGNSLLGKRLNPCVESGSEGASPMTCVHVGL